MDKKIPWEIADIIVARLSDSITEEKNRILEEWLNSSSDHQKLYNAWIQGKHFREFCLQSEQYDFVPKYNVLCDHIKREKQGRQRRFWRYAAAAIILPFILFIWRASQHELLPVPEVSNEILPGQYKALLTLPGGETLSLAQSTNELSVQHIPAILFRDTLTYKFQDTLTGEEYHTISIPRGGEYVLKLADGTYIWLNSESELRYPVGFVGAERKVFLKGEAYFKVAHDSLHPFIVETSQQKLTVLGTSFAVRAYSDEQSVLTTLETGKVRVVTGNSQITLHPGYQSKLKEGHLNVEKVNTAQFTAWYKGKFIFIDQPLGEIMNTLSRWYNTEVFYINSDLDRIKFTGELQRYADIREFLEKLEKLEKVRFHISGRTVTVSRY